MHDSDIAVAAITEQLYGDPTDAVNITLIDLHGHPHEFALSVDDADELAALLRLAVAG